MAWVIPVIPFDELTWEKAVILRLENQAPWLATSSKWILEQTRPKCEVHWTESCRLNAAP